MANTQTSGGTATMNTFLEYLNTCNQALDAHREEFPYKQIAKAGEKLLKGKNIGVAVYKGNSDSPHDYFTISMDDGHFGFVAHGKQSTDLTWKTSEEYLREVVGNKRKYIENPAHLDLDWIKSRLGLSQS